MKAFTVTLITVLLTMGCSPIEKQAYQLVVASNAFLKSMHMQHPECTSQIAAVTPLCQHLAQAVSAKDALIDAVEVYCAGPNFNGGGKCDPPAKGTPVFVQADAKLRYAIQSYEQVESDLKLAVKGVK